LLVLPPFLGLDGVWLAQPISDTLAISITLYFLVKQFKKMKRLELAKGEKH
ncbi:MATE family efflux transporter, partial [Turicibacter sanguinis]|nr:MATE family efflux transporter [Turicibacter sanguinis]